MKYLSSTESPPSPAAIRALAYQLWQQAQCPLGRDLEFWLQAEQQRLPSPHPSPHPSPPLHPAPPRRTTQRNLQLSPQQNPQQNP